MNTLSKQPFKLIIILIIVVGVAIRLVNLEQKVYWKDEVFTSLRVSGYTEEDVNKKLYTGKTLSLEDLHKYQQTTLFNNPIGTVYGLAKEEAQLPPLYFLIVKLWVSLFGNSVTVTRSISAILSIISCLIIYLLCRELFDFKMVAWVGMALFAVSPFHIIYSQVARPYSLWLLTSLLSSWLVLRALKINHKTNWGMYTFSIMMGLYTSPFSLFLNLGQGVYIFSQERFKFNQIVKKYLISFVIGILGFSPWLLIIVLRYHQIKGRTNWSSYSYSNGIPELVFNWLRNITRLFVDFDQLNGGFTYIYQHPFLYLVFFIPITFLVGYSIYFLCRNTPKSTWLFIILWIASTAFPLMLADMILGGKRSGTARYLLPSYLGFQIATAYFLATQTVNSSIVWKQKLWQSITVFLCCIGLFSSIYISPKSFWWSNDPSRYLQNPEVVQIINKNPNSLVISDAIWDEVMTLSYSLSPEIKYQLVKSSKTAKTPDNFSNYFLYKPSQNLQKQFQENPNYRIKPSYQSDDPWLWEIEKK
ncbi:glycosyltransferase family 39 protein [Crocosphaera sp. UHCC 0190]|uniref:glycosyltransferase family 39 protein n=1 Tax=Crocosphaera sp. UHCC 0190 TaxID=3110246 RepID=UPI002B21EC14|nr:glycosyltransferase family 39 protein [Crocosphaera sp. UHCC 0190]MEA5510294.1 glycosyltransferase family 39 protein [Crocosphaera sp. UHCC 0190]